MNSRVGIVCGFVVTMAIMFYPDFDAKVIHGDDPMYAQNKAKARAERIEKRKNEVQASCAAAQQKNDSLHTSKTQTSGEQTKMRADCQRNQEANVSDKTLVWFITLL